MATSAWWRRPSCSPFPSGISPSPSRGGPGLGWVSARLGGNPSPPNPPLEGEGFKAGFVEGDGSEPGNRILPCRSNPLRYANTIRLLRRAEEHTYELQSLMRISSDVFRWQKKILL